MFRVLLIDLFTTEDQDGQTLNLDLLLLGDFSGMHSPQIKGQVSSLNILAKHTLGVVSLRMKCISSVSALFRRQHGIAFLGLSKLKLLPNIIVQFLT